MRRTPQLRNTLSTRDYAVIQAGGNGTRLWPLSQKSKPKQFQLLLGNKSLLQKMYEHLSRSFAPDHIYIQVPSQFVPLVHEQFSNLSDEQIIVEPEARDTGPAFAYSAAVLNNRDPEAQVGFFYSDHLIQNEEIFDQTLREGFHTLNHYPNHLIMLGVRPLYAHTGLGYIEQGEAKHVPGLKKGVYVAQMFIEKPDIGRAREFMISSRHLWNTGCKIVRVRQLIDMFIETNESYKKVLPRLLVAISSADHKHSKSLFSTLPRLSFEYLITEKAKNLFVLESDMLWADIGDWEAIHRALSQESQETLHTSGSVIEHDCENTLIVSHHRPVIAVGVKNIVVIETKDAILVMSKEHSQDIKLALDQFLKSESGQI